MIYILASILSLFIVAESSGSLYFLGRLNGLNLPLALEKCQVEFSSTGTVSSSNYICKDNKVTKTSYATGDCSGSATMATVYTTTNATFNCDGSQNYVTLNLLPSGCLSNTSYYSYVATGVCVNGSGDASEYISFSCDGYSLFINIYGSQDSTCTVLGGFSEISDCQIFTTLTSSTTVIYVQPAACYANGNKYTATTIMPTDGTPFNTGGPDNTPDNTQGTPGTTKGENEGGNKTTTKSSGDSTTTKSGDSTTTKSSQTTTTTSTSCTLTADVEVTVSANISAYCDNSEVDWANTFETVFDGATISVTVSECNSSSGYTAFEAIAFFPNQTTLTGVATDLLIIATKLQSNFDSGAYSSEITVNSFTFTATDGCPEEIQALSSNAYRFNVLFGILISIVISFFLY